MELGWGVFHGTNYFNRCAKRMHVAYSNWRAAPGPCLLHASNNYLDTELSLRYAWLSLSCWFYADYRMLSRLWLQPWTRMQGMVEKDGQLSLLSPILQTNLNAILNRCGCLVLKALQNYIHVLYHSPTCQACRDAFGICETLHF